MLDRSGLDERALIDEKDDDVSVAGQWAQEPAVAPAWTVFLRRLPTAVACCLVVLLLLGAAMPTAATSGGQVPTAPDINALHRFLSTQLQARVPGMVLAVSHGPGEAQQLELGLTAYLSSSAPTGSSAASAGQH
jgi:hypothetical protein